MDYGVLRAVEDVANAFARLDEQVSKPASALGRLLMLRSAQAIVAANDRPLGDAPGSAESTRPIPDGDAAFAALIGWWYEPASREFIADDPHLRGVAVALEAAAEKVHGGRLLTSGLIDEAMQSADLQLEPLPDLLDATLSVAEHESWPALMLAADLCAGACGRARAVSASIARAVAPLSSALTATVFVVPRAAEDLAGALHAMAHDARTLSRQVAAYRDDCSKATATCEDFGRGGASAHALVDLLARQPAVTVASVARALDLTAPTAGAAVERLAGAKLLREITGRGRDRVFVYTPAVTLAF